MIRRIALLVLVSLVIVTSGCIDGSPDGTASPSMTDDRTPVSPGTTAECSYTLHVEIADKEQISDTEKRSDYGNLSEEHQAEFQEALGKDYADLGEEYPKFWDRHIVNYSDTRYLALLATC
jgi:hypothetical protein